MINNYIGLWTGEWGIINVYYMWVYHILFLPMMLYILGFAVKGLIKQNKKD